MHARAAQTDKDMDQVSHSVCKEVGFNIDSFSCHLTVLFRVDCQYLLGSDFQKIWIMEKLKLGPRSPKHLNTVNLIFIHPICDDCCLRRFIPLHIVTYRFISQSRFINFDWLTQPCLAISIQIKERK